MAEEEENNTSPDQEKDYLTDIIEESGDVVFASSSVLLKIEKRELHSRAKMDFCSNFICGNVRFPKRLRLCFSGFRLD